MGHHNFEADAKYPLESASKVGLQLRQYGVNASTQRQLEGKYLAKVVLTAKISSSGQGV